MSKKKTPEATPEITPEVTPEAPKTKAPITKLYPVFKDGRKGKNFFISGVGKVLIKAGEPVAEQIANALSAVKDLTFERK